MQFAKRSVLPGAINLVDMRRLWRTTEPTTKGFNLFKEIATFVVVVSAATINKRKTSVTVHAREKISHG